MLLKAGASFYPGLPPDCARGGQSGVKNTFGGFIEGDVDASAMDQQLQSYLGIMSHANKHNLSQAHNNAFWVR